MARENYADQVQLLVRLLPVIATEPAFALKGGTAINLFYRDLPRLSVDIDLTYLPLKDRAESLADIAETLGRIETAIAKIDGVEVKPIAGGGGGETRLQARSGGVVVKVETSPVTRGTVFAPASMRVSKAVEDEFGFAEIQVVSFEDLFAGKLHAALDRQHPRDLFDVKLLYEHEGITDDLFRVFLIYLASSNRPAHELLNPNPIDISQLFETEFAGMTFEDVELAVLDATRKRLIDDIQSRLVGPAAEFLRSLQNGEPDFNLIGLPDAAALPAVKWKLLNLKKLIEQVPEKHAAQTASLEALLD